MESYSHLEYRCTYVAFEMSMPQRLAKALRKPWRGGEVIMYSGGAGHFSEQPPPLGIRALREYLGAFDHGVDIHLSLVQLNASDSDVIAVLFP